MLLSFVIGPIVEGLSETFAEAVAEFAGEFSGEVFGAALVARALPFKRSYSKAYCDAFFCAQCYGMAEAKKSKLKWHVYQCRDCQGRWGVLKAKPWVRRERARRETAPTARRDARF